MRPDAELDIAVIGGGISGITTAILLQITGHPTALYTTIQPCFEPGAGRPEEFATLHAAASVIPHSVASPKLSHWTGISQHFFRALSLPGSCGVRRQLHYEISEDPNEAAPGYAGSVENFAWLTADELNQPWVPKRSAARGTYGWKFDAFFCEAPEYLRFLYAFYARIGGRLRQPPAVDGLAPYLALGHDIFVNCTGFGAYGLLESATRDPRCTDNPMLPDFEPLIDPFPPKLIRGHYLRMDIKEILTGHRGQFLSYSYKPTTDIYRTATGLAADVYCYQRSDAWILGGSRQVGSIDDHGNWFGEQTVGGEREFARRNAPPLAVPAPIFELNADILLRLSNGRVDLERLRRNDPGIVSPGIGYRFVRASESDNVRVSCSRVQFGGDRKYILHNYGHGGSGYTLSWGCAFDILQMLGRITEVPPQLAGHSKFAIGDTAIRGLLGNVIARLLSHGA
ncbi:MAG: FAD-dependent oxidoreductase [Acetobacteraceae bacterium]